MSISPTAVPTGSFISPQALMAIKNLEMRARIVVQGFWTGLHRSPYHGFSVEFTEYRQYTPGDDPRYLDWRLYARTDRYYIKRFEDETNVRCFLLVDNSRSMTFGSTGYTKAEYANTLAATLGYFLHQQGDAVGLLTFDEGIREYLPARHRPGHVRQLMLALEKPAAGTATDLSAPLQRIVEMVRRRGLMILISDLLAPIDALDRHLGSLIVSGHEVMVFHVLDPQELKFQFDTATLFEDMESARELYIDPAAARRDYLQKFQAHIAAARQICEKLGVSYHQWTSDRHLETALFDFLKARLQRGKKASGSRRNLIGHV
jgi:uncharacterized protein (DUF58 family)